MGKLMVTDFPATTKKNPQSRDEVVIDTKLSPNEEGSLESNNDLFVATLSRVLESVSCNDQ